MPKEFRLPPRYTALLAVLAPRSEERVVWLGDVGFRLPTAADDLGSWPAALAETRWFGMHPDLVPFASDGFGNQFCFYYSGREVGRGLRTIVYWMYETYRAVPIASSFDGFLAWVTLSATVQSRRDDPVVDRAHIEQELLPALEAVDLAFDIDAALDEPDPTPASMHRAQLRLDPDAAAPRVALACNLTQRGQRLEGLDLCAEASFAFPEFAAARAAAARILAEEREEQALFDALFQTLQRPLVYGGDPSMPGFRRLQEVDPSWTAEMLANHPQMPDVGPEEPLWGLVMHDDPTAPQSWAQAALEYAELGDLEAAVVMASNALFFGFGTELGGPLHGLLQELYTALERPWHAAAMERCAAGPESARARSR